MEQNKFEKEIQQKLDELAFRPSESVWQQVEKGIENKDGKRRRALIIFFLFLVIVICGLWLFNSETKNARQSQPGKAHDMVILSTSTDSVANNSLGSEKKDSNKIAFEKVEGAVASTGSLNKNEQPYKRKSRKTGFLKKGNFKVGLQNVTAVENENEIGPAEKSQKLQNDLSHEKLNLITSKEEVNTDIHQQQLNETGRDSVMQLARIIDQPQKKDTDLAVSAKKLPVANHHKKWAFGVTISGGMSLVGNEFLAINNSSYGDYMSSPGTGSGSGYPSSHLPSATRNSIAFITGVFAEKNISVRNKISVGINYKYYSTLNAVGNKIDSAQIAYYLSATTNAVNNHRNNFNYLELPVNLKFRLGNNSSLPFYWQAGINISQLISSNALQFQSTPGLYYNDNSVFNKMQLGFSTAISATLFSKQKIPVTVAPYINYSASRLAGEGLYKNKHFSFVGIRTEILFEKK